MKKLTLCLALGLAAQSAAAMNFQVPEYQTYLGLGAARDLGTWNWNELISSTRTIRDGDRLWGTAAELHVGMLFPVRHWLVGLELGGYVSDAEHKLNSSTNANEQRLTRPYGVNVSVLPTFPINHQQVFARFGWDYSKLRYWTNDASYTGLQFKKAESGVVTGLGVRAPISKHFALSQEYRHAFYERIGRQSGSDTLKVNPGADSYWVSLDYFFSPQAADKNINALQSGFYLGLGGGRDLPTFDNYRNASNTITTRQEGLSGVVGQMVAGYRMQFWHLVPALEVLASISDSEYTLNHSTAANSYKFYFKKPMLGARLKLGYKTNDSNQVFLGGGVARTNVKKTGGTTFGGNFDKNVNGATFVLGDEFQITEHASAALEWDYTRFQRVKPTGQYSWRPVDERAVVSFNYHF